MNKKQLKEVPKAWENSKALKRFWNIFRVGTKWISGGILLQGTDSVAEKVQMGEQIEETLRGVCIILGDG